jgi:hypothetical protein
MWFDGWRGDPVELADELASSSAGVLRVEDGWYADFTVADDHVVMFIGRAGRAEAVAYGTRSAHRRINSTGVSSPHTRTVRQALCRVSRPDWPNVALGYQVVAFGYEYSRRA